MSSRREVKAKESGPKSPESWVLEKTFRIKFTSMSQNHGQRQSLLPTLLSSLCLMMLCLRLGSGPPTGRPPSPDPCLPFALAGASPEGSEQLALSWHIYRMNLLLFKAQASDTEGIWAAQASSPQGRWPSSLMKEQVGWFGSSEDFCCDRWPRAIGQEFSPFPHIQETLAAG